MFGEVKKMRELKFRAWDTYYYQMVYQDDILTNGKILERYDIIMQYTGLKDKNEKEIYEGDILQDECAGELLKFEVVWEDKKGRFNRKNIPYMAGGLSSGEGVEIIGNIFENPDLLEGEK